MENLKKVNYKRIANVLKINKNAITDFQDVLIKENKVQITNLDVLFIHNTINFDISDARKVDKDIINNFELSDKNTSKLYDLDNWDIEQNFTYGYDGENFDVWFNNSDLQHLYNAVPFVSKDELRPAMTGVCVNGGICGTDAHKMYFYNDFEAKKEFILPVEFIKIMELLKIQNCNLEVNDKFAYLRTQEFTLICKIIDAKYPNYKVVIPEDNPFNISIDKKQLLTALKQLQPFVNKSTNRISLKTENNNVVLYACDLDRNIEQTIIIPECVNNLEEGFKIGLNLKFMQICIKPLDKIINFALSAPNRAIVLNDKVLLMPVMLHS